MLPQLWSAAMEATMFSGWIYDHLKLHAAALKVAHPLMLRAIAAAKKKNDRIDADKICDCLPCDFRPECYMAPTAIRERRRTLRYRNLLVRQMVQTASRQLSVAFGDDHLYRGHRCACGGSGWI
jgi:transposase